MHTLIIASILATGAISLLIELPIIANPRCIDDPDENVSTNWLDITSVCVAELKLQIRDEMSAAIVYLAMAAHFSRNTINRPGFAKLFFESANEERTHAIELIQYLLSRGQLSNDVTNLIKFRKPKQTIWHSGYDALQDAFLMEVAITERIRKIAKICESDNDNNENDDVIHFLISKVTNEQLKSTHKYAGRVSTLSKLIKLNGHLGEFLFDKELLKEN